MSAYRRLHTGDEKIYTITINRADNVVYVEDTLKDLQGEIDGEYIINIKNKTKVSTYSSQIIQNGALSVLITDSFSDLVLLYLSTIF